MAALTVSLFLIAQFGVTTKALGSQQRVPRPNHHKSIRQLLPHPAMPHPNGHRHSGYHGCFWVSDDESYSKAATYFGDNIPPCTVFVNDTLVLGSESDSSGSGGSSSGSEDSGLESGGTSSSSSGSDGSGSTGYSNNDDDRVDNNYYGNANDDGSYTSPLVYFDLTDCGSYSNLWLWDLALSCDNSTSMENCQCTSAEILFQYGTIQCPDGTIAAPVCPSSCRVCNTCMSLLGCVDKLPFPRRIPINIPVNLERTINRALPIALGVAAALLTLLSGIAAYKYKNREKDKSVRSLHSSLVEGQSESTFEIDIAGNVHVL